VIVCMLFVCGICVVVCYCESCECVVGVCVLFVCVSVCVCLCVLDFLIVCVVRLCRV